MRISAIAMACVAILTAGCLAGTQTPVLPPTRTATAPLVGAPTFGTAHVVDRQRGSEPSIAIDRAGRIWVSSPTGVGGISPLWMSSDNGTSWTAEADNLFGAGGRGLGGGDTSIAVGRDGSVWVTDLWAGSSEVSVTKDGGKTWTDSPIGDEVPFNDREWNTVDAKGHGYYLGRTFSPAIAAWVARSDDGGRTWRQVGNPWMATPGATEANQGHQDGPLITNPKTDEIAVVYTCATNEVCVSKSGDLGVTWHPVVAAKAAGPVGNLFPALAADREGNWYVAYAESQGAPGGQAIKLVWSADGTQWSAPVNVTSTAADRLMPWIVAGDQGRVALTWYQASVAGDSNNKTTMAHAVWNVAVAESTDAMDLRPVFAMANASASPNHQATVSTRGFNPLDRNPPDRGLGDFFTTALDATGMIHIAYVNGSAGAGFQTMEVAQASGPSLFADGLPLSGAMSMPMNEEPGGPISLAAPVSPISSTGPSSSS